MNKFNADIRILTRPYIDISSTEIRTRIKNNQSVKYMITDDTLNYINKFNLYKD